ncbi:MAG: hypothetical protein GX221_08270 [Candidatus Riflebacteria bacterium]|nr:hypothetical protein [Candidatus Riflebacteria bacterium]
MTDLKLYRREVLNSFEGRSLTIINGKPEQVASSDANIAAKGLAGKDNDSLVLSGKQNSETAELLKNFTANDLQTFKSYGILLTADNLKKLQEIFAQMPKGFKNPEIASLIFSRGLSVSSLPFLNKYFTGNLKFASIFEHLPEAKLASLKNIFSFATSLEGIEKLVTELISGAWRENLKKTTSFCEGLAENLFFQELLSSKIEDYNRIYFQMPLFWQNNDFPDTLEGEAYVPLDKEGKKNKDSALRLLLSPPRLGQMEVSLHSLDATLWVHMGVQKAVLPLFQSIIGDIREAVLNRGDYEKVIVSSGEARNLQNFFSLKNERFDNTASKIDFKA